MFIISYNNIFKWKTADDYNLGKNTPAIIIISEQQTR